MLKSVRDAVVAADASGCVLMLNPAAEAISGWAEADAIGKPVNTVISLCASAQAEAGASSGSREVEAVNPVHALLNRPTLQSAEPLILIGRDGRRTAVQAAASRIEDPPYASILVLNDVGEAQQLAARMAYLAQHDPLTGLPNRILLVDRLEQATKLADRLSEQLAVLFLDIDHFHALNDSLGRTLADEVLRQVAYRLTEALRESDTVCRLGGDAFVILLSGLKSFDAAETLAAKLLAEVHRPYPIGEHSIQATCSIGISLYPANASDATTLMRLADGAMYQAKTSGGNQYVSAAAQTVTTTNH